MEAENIPVASFHDQLYQMILVEFSDLLPPECYVLPEEKTDFKGFDQF